MTKIMNEGKVTSYPKEKVNVLFLENISDSAVKLFKDEGYSSVKKLTGALSEEDLKEFCHDRLTGYKRPRQIEFRDELPKSNVGKILRRELRDEKKPAA